MKKHKKHKIIYGIAVIVILVAFVAYGTFAYYKGWFPFIQQDTVNDFKRDEQGRGVNPKKTKLEREQAESLQVRPQNKLDRPNTDVAPPAEKKTPEDKRSAYVMVTSVEQSVDKSTIAVSGFVANVTEREGACVYVFTSIGGQIVRKTAAALPNPSSTLCESVRVGRDELISGVWFVTLEYNSQLSRGISDKMTITIE